MAREKFIDWNPGADMIELVQRANQIAADYLAQGYDLTVRQLYYQFVARGWIPNNERSYKRLIGATNQARLAGMLDWNYLVDRTRNLSKNSHWSDPAGIIESAARGYGIDLWSSQPKRVEVWVEKEALAGIVDQAASRLDCAWFACRGYVSQSEMYVAAQRFLRYAHHDQDIVVLHLGDHDPSGIDMTRDITERLALLTYEGTNLTVERIALNMDQVEQYQPPPNPAKMTDSRFEAYQAEFGEESWELDALDPATLDALITEHIEANLDQDLYQEREGRQESDRDQLNEVSGRWDEVIEHLAV